MKNLLFVSIVSDGTESSANWVERLRSFLATAPDGITFNVQDVSEGLCRQIADAHFETIGIEEIYQYVSSNLQSRNKRASARAILYWLVENMSHKLVVICTACKSVRGDCYCSSRRASDISYYALHPLHKDQEDQWVIGRQSLLEFDVTDLREITHVSAILRDRIIQALHYFQAQR